MTKDTEKTKVIFRRWKKTFDEQQGIVAIFPEVPYGENSRYCSSWEYVGEHGGCHPEAILENTVPANTEEYIEDAKFLESQYGYNLEIIDSLPQDARDTRRASLESYLIED